MNYKTLISQSKTEFDSRPNQVEPLLSLKLFNTGAKWMFDKLQKKENGTTIEFNNKTSFASYGLLKYSISLSCAIFSLLTLWRYNTLLIPISILVFYFIEVHFLFLFPLLIDKVKNPISESIKQTYRLGLLTTTLIVIQIGFFMIIGLFNYKNPFRNWHIGCFSIIIWYKYEVRDRL